MEEETRAELVDRRSPLRHGPVLLALALALAVLCRSAWVSDDGFITVRIAHLLKNSFS